MTRRVRPVLGRRALGVVVLAVAGAGSCGRFPTRHASPLRVLVLNMHAGKDAVGTPNLDRVAGLVRDTKPALVLLQEVDRGTKRSGGTDQVAALGAATRYATAFAPSLLHYDGGEYGIALLSRQFSGYRATEPLPVAPVQARAGGSREPRVALVASADVGKTAWMIVNTHLDPSDEMARAQEIARLVDIIRVQLLAGVTLVAGGDFNSTPDNPVLQPLRAVGLRDAWAECGTGDGFTYPADKPAKRIDYLWLAGALHCASAQVLDTQVSDHRPLLVTMK